MIPTAIRMKTRVLPGRLIEIPTPQLEEGADVEVTVVVCEPQSTTTKPQGVWDWLQSLPPVERTPEEWAAVERELQAERDSWER